ncbi:monooxygenase [Thermopolyspora flexuosa]|uniref:Monoamine oxidase n=1 Tax=Thermopolyspora flexuosa TaxID=103836 RepID=A0A543IQ61_9ACTN|nr:FAD-dependent oxidoreductase [Thermopolyspora flexuosa]TQM72711.1 monoamine oxidase [Thermopolyspora flexuosa]GGM68506.1 monooxygenase [Thermopolyspora flexuosa]
MTPRLTASTPREADVVVIGAGLSGLVTARLLHRAGLRVLVLEAKNRVGGRLLTTTTTAGVALDAGGAWVGPGQDAVLALLDELGIALIPQYTAGHNLLRIGGRTHRYRGDLPRLGPAALLDLARARRAVDRMARRLGPPPLTGPYAARLDTWTVAAWLDRHVHTRAARLILQVATAASFACRPEELSLLAFAAHVGGNGGLSRLIGVRDGALAHRIAGGAATLTARLANELTGRILLGHPVTRITRTADHATVTVPGRTPITARRVVIAMDPATARTIAHDPPLPPPRADLQTRWQTGSGVKAHLVYPRPWWRDLGLTGAAVTDTGTVRLTFDVSPPGDGSGILLVLLGLPLIDDPALLHPDARDRRRRKIVDDLTALFGPKARDPIEYREQDWSAEPWQTGCLPRVPPGLLGTHHAWLTRPIGPLHWAGSETSYLGEGHMDGAVRSAHRAATEVLDSLDCKAHGAL